MLLNVRQYVLFDTFKKGTLRTDLPYFCCYDLIGTMLQHHSSVLNAQMSILSLDKCGGWRLPIADATIGS